MVDDSTDYWQAGLDKTVASVPSGSQCHNIEHNETGAAGAAGAAGASQADTTYAKEARRPLKRKARDALRQSPSKFTKFLVANCTSNSSIGGPSEVPDSSIDNGSKSESESKSEIDSDFDGSPIQKKRKVEDHQSDRKDPHDEAIVLPATISNSEQTGNLAKDDGTKEKKGTKQPSQGSVNDKVQSHTRVLAYSVDA